MTNKATLSKLAGFLFPKKLSTREAQLYSEALLGLYSPTTGLRDGIAIFTAANLLHKSWTCEEEFSFKEFIQTIGDLQKHQTAIAYIEKIRQEQEQHLKKVKPENSIGYLTAGSVAVANIGILGEQEQTGYVPFRTIIEASLEHYQDLMDLGDFQSNALVEHLWEIKATMQFMRNSSEIEKIVKKAASKKGSSEVKVEYGSTATSETNEEAEQPATEIKEGFELAIYDAHKATQVAHKMASKQKGPMDGNNKQMEYLVEMAQSSSIRELCQVPTDLNEKIQELHSRFPHFKEVISYIERRLALASCGTKGKAIKLPPILLRGAPGTGKTYFCQEIARIFGMEFIEKDLSITSEAFVISGMDSSWKNSKPGVVFDALVQGKTANPLICLNEIDKARVTGANSSPLSSLYWLLEPTSSYRFQDEFIPLELRADNIFWMMTANDGFIPDPLLSRMEVFDIRHPSKEECREISKSVWKNVCSRELPFGHSFETNLRDEVLDKMADTSPRLMRKILTDAASIAALNKRNYITAEDCNKYMEVFMAPPKKTTIGFVSQ